MDHEEVPVLFRKFAAPLAGYAVMSPARKELAEMLARNLWTALIAGPEMEEETWNVFKKHANLDDDSLQSIKELYFEQMKPVERGAACGPAATVSSSAAGTVTMRVRSFHLGDYS